MMTVFYSGQKIILLNWTYNCFSFLTRSLVVLLSVLMVSCSRPRTDLTEEKLFNNISPEQSGLDFENKLVETLTSNYYQYMYTYIGGGVATADFNNDGKIDLFFISNQYDNKLYLNKGGLKFEDITLKAGIKKRPGFDTGVAIVDINNDGFLDIYICRGGWEDEDERFANMLYINNGDLTFTEMAKPLGLDDSNRSISASFFDYDNDGDLDVYIANSPDFTSRAQVLDLKAIQTDPKTLEKKGFDKLYNNNGNGHFTDVSLKAGILPDVGFGLHPQVGDLNNDGWLDVYISNDFNIPDFAYVNNQDGTFREARNELLKHMSLNSMGGDLADINNDGLLDLMTLDMNPEDYVRSKTTMGMISSKQFNTMVEKDHHHQYMHNMLQLNNGNGTFSEISKMAGMSNTDWSWSLLSADFDLDGYNDLYVTNGVYRDVIDKDKNSEILQILRSNNRKPTAEDFLAFTKMFPQQKLTNYFFRNKGDLTFENTSGLWSDSSQTFSNGASYADLDNDGDLDIIVNNINDKATLLRNNAIESDMGDFIQMRLKGPDSNRFGIGTIVKVYLSDSKIQMRQLINTRGFLSSVSNTLHFGIGKNGSIVKIEVCWQNGRTQTLNNIASNQLLMIDYADAVDVEESKYNDTNKKFLFTKVKSNFRHEDPVFDDYSRQILLPHKLSQTGPAVAKADVNGDGLEDIYLGGGKGQAGQLFFGEKNKSLESKNVLDFTKDKQYEDVSACFFDADGDGDKDLYVVSGSYEFYRTPTLLQDRLYLNNGKGRFLRVKDLLPKIHTAGSVVVPCDYDNDGDIDLFVGGRVVPDRYPFAPISYLLINDHGAFAIDTKERAADLERVGMVTDAVWKDLNKDGNIDLIVTGEWMGIEVFTSKNGKLSKDNSYESLSKASGWWNKLLVADIDNDGDDDIVAGNLGLNYKFHASVEKPFHIYTRDFDYNGTEDIILAKDYKGRQVPVRGKTCTAQQIPHLKRKIQTYGDFASRDIDGILGGSLASALHYQATEFRSGIFINESNGDFTFSPFTSVVQKSPINSILYEDFDHDGNKDLLLAGNNYQSEIETTRADAGIGVFLKGDGRGEFEPWSNLKSGFFANKDVRNMLSVMMGKEQIVFVVNNNDQHDLFVVK